MLPPRYPAPTTPRAALVRLLVLGVAIGLLIVGERASRRTVALTVDGHTLHLTTHQRTARRLLAVTGIPLADDDLLDPPPDAPLTAAVLLRRARDVVIAADGAELRIRGHFTTPADVLAASELVLDPHDAVHLNGQPVSPSAPLPLGSPRAPAPLRLDIRRATAITVVDDGVARSFYTPARTVGAALDLAHIPVFAADRLNMGLDAPIVHGLRVILHRARAVTVVVDGHSRAARTQAATVGGLLVELGVRLGAQDRVDPPLNAPLAAHVSVVRPPPAQPVAQVRSEHITEEEPIPFEEINGPTPLLELDHEGEAQAGQPGLKRRTIRIDYIDGQPPRRVVEREWVERAPVPRIVGYGTRVVLRDVPGASGLRYWRRVPNVLLTSYTAATSGKTRDHPAYGITRIGWQAQKGIIAVDPRYIPFHTRMWVPGYGIGVAADTGGLIKGWHIDLCYDEDSLVLWWSKSDIYLLEPVPPADQIQYRLRP